MNSTILWTCSQDLSATSIKHLINSYKYTVPSDSTLFSYAVLLRKWLTNSCLYTNGSLPRV